jgi:hypothetical protein
MGCFLTAASCTRVSRQRQRLRYVFPPYCNLHTLNVSSHYGHLGENELSLPHTLRCKAGKHSERYIVDIIWWQRRSCRKRGNTSYQIL